MVFFLLNMTLWKTYTSLVKSKNADATDKLEEAAQIWKGSQDCSSQLIFWESLTPDHLSRVVN